MADDVNLSQVAQDLPGLSGDTLLASTAELVVFSLWKGQASILGVKILCCKAHLIESQWMMTLAFASTLFVLETSIKFVRAVQ